MDEQSVDNLCAEAIVKMDVSVSDEMEPEFLIEEEEEEEQEQEADDILHEYVLQCDNKEITVKVNQKTAYLLSNDHCYAEQYLSEIESGGKALASPEVEYLHDMEPTPTTVPIVIARKMAGNSCTTDKNTESGKSEGFWSWTRHSTELLINIRVSMEDKFQDQDYKKSFLWNQVASEVGALTAMTFTGDVCFSKWQNLLSTYKLNQRRAVRTGQVPDWPFYTLFHDAYGHLSTSSNLMPMNETRRTKERVKRSMAKTDTNALVKTRLSMEGLFAEADGDDEELWEAIAREVNLDPNVWTEPVQTCKDKWNYLIHKYREKLDPDAPEDAQILWPYFKDFHAVYGGEIPQQHLSERKYDGGLWTTSRVKLLLQLRVSMGDQFSTPGTKKARLWSEIAENLNNTFSTIYVTGTECDEKYRSCLKCYRMNVVRLREKGYVMWPHFQILHDAYGEFGENYMLRPTKRKPLPTTNATKLWTGKNVELLIRCRLEMESSFVNRKCKVSTLWCAIAKKLNAITESSAFIWMGCLGKWRKLKIHYDDIVQKSKKSGATETVWPYFEMFEQVYGSGAHETSSFNVHSHFDDTHDGEGFDDSQSATDTSKQLKKSVVPTKKPTPVILKDNVFVKQAGPSKSFASQKTTNSSPKKVETRPQDSSSNFASTFHASTSHESTLLRNMLTEWKTERRQRWEEKKVLEQAKIQALKDLTKAVLSLDKRDNVIYLPPAADKVIKSPKKIMPSRATKRPRSDEET